MWIESIIWDLDDDPDGNVRHCVDGGVTKVEVEQALERSTDCDISRSSGLSVAFGETDEGRHLIVVI